MSTPASFPPVDKSVISNFLTIIHNHIQSLGERLKPRITDVGLLQLVCIDPENERRIGSREFEIGDIDPMIDLAVRTAERGLNVYIEPRTITRSFALSRHAARLECTGRGSKEDTRFVYAFLVDGDADKGKFSAVDIEPSILVELSPGNQHTWLLLDRLISWPRAYELGRRLRKAVSNTDSSTGCITTPFRVAGTPNYPNRGKIERGRVIVPTRIIAHTSRLWSVRDMCRAFPELPAGFRASTGDIFAEYDLIHLAYALNAIPNRPPVDRNTWRNIVLACHHAASVAETPKVAKWVKDICTEWSLQSKGCERSRRYNGRGREKLWRWADEQQCSNPITVQSLYYIAYHEYGWDPTESNIKHDALVRRAFDNAAEIERSEWERESCQIN